MWVIISEHHCVVQCGRKFYVCKRTRSGKLDCLQECDSYQEAERIYRNALFTL